MLLWKSVVSNQLLANTNLVLFLNKCDVLRSKLRAGIRLGKYVISYGDRPNDFEHASECTWSLNCLFTFTIDRLLDLVSHRYVVRPFPYDCGSRR